MTKNPSQVFEHLVQTYLDSNNKTKLYSSIVNLDHNLRLAIFTYRKVKNVVQLYDDIISYSKLLAQ